MFTADFEVAPPENWMQSFATQLGMPFDSTSNRIEFDRTFGKGEIQGHEFQAGFWMIQFDLEFRQEVVIRRLGSDNNDYFTLSYYLEEVDLQTPQKPIPPLYYRTNAIYFHSGRIEGNFNFRANTRVKLLVVAFSRFWLEKKLVFNEFLSESIFHQLLHSGKPIFVSETIQPESRRLLQEIYEQPWPSYLHSIITESQSLELLTRFFTQLDRKELVHLKRSMNLMDVQKIIQVKNTLLANPQNRPRIADLALETAMSESKFKRLFTEIVGESIYAYYQKIRMEWAKSLLEEGTMSVSDVGYMVGYTNLGHFSQAFRKHHGTLPSNI